MLILKKLTFPIFTVLLISSPFIIKTTKKNTCTSYLDYFLINFGGDCYYNPDVDLSLSEIIQKYSGSVLNYTVTTEDGYILTMFRIFRKDPVGVVLLQPPLTTSAVLWLQDGGESLPMILWKKGYDVWLSNHRGAPYSRKHVNLTENDPRFWDFSFHEIALYDFDAQFEIISEETHNSKITYIGYSLSSTEALVYASMKTQTAQKYVNDFILIAPVSVLSNFSSVFRYLFYILGYIEVSCDLYYVDDTISFVQNFLGNGEFFTFEVIRWFGKYVSYVPHCNNFLVSVCLGWTLSEMDPVLDPFLHTHYGRGVSNKMLYHYAQIYLNQTNFLMYDYGTEENRKLYGTDFPPPYSLQNVENSIHLIHGDTDTLATPSDVMILSQELLPKDKIQGIYKIFHHNHLDHVFSKRRKKETYSIVSSILDNLYN